MLARHANAKVTGAIYAGVSESANAKIASKLVYAGIGAYLHPRVRTAAAGSGAHLSCAPPTNADQRSDRRPARTSSANSCGCSQAAKCPPLSTSLK